MKENRIVRVIRDRITKGERSGDQTPFIKGKSYQHNGIKKTYTYENHTKY
jgi:hypothetical protein